MTPALDALAARKPEDRDCGRPELSVSWRDALQRPLVPAVHDKPARDLGFRHEDVLELQAGVREGGEEAFVEGHDVREARTDSGVAVEHGVLPLAPDTARQITGFPAVIGLGECLDTFVFVHACLRYAARLPHRKYLWICTLDTSGRGFCRRRGFRESVR